MRLIVMCMDSRRYLKSVRWPAHQMFQRAAIHRSVHQAHCPGALVATHAEYLWPQNRLHDTIARGLIAPINHSRLHVSCPTYPIRPKGLNYITLCFDYQFACEFAEKRERKKTSRKSSFVRSSHGEKIQCSPKCSKYSLDIICTIFLVNFW